MIQTTVRPAYTELWRGHIDKMLLHSTSPMGHGGKNSKVSFSSKLAQFHKYGQSIYYVPNAEFMRTIDPMVLL